MFLGNLELYGKSLLAYPTYTAEFWHCLMWIGRILPWSIGGSIYSDDGYMWKCDTLRNIGCWDSCFNKFSPINHHRFFFYFYFFLFLPKFVLAVFITHEETAFEKSKKLEIPINTSIKQTIRKNHYQGNAKFGIFSSRIRLGQILHLVATIAIEIFGLVSFNWLQQLGNSTEFEDLKFFQFGKYLLQKEVYECKNLTVCANQEDDDHTACFIPRQSEKNFLVIYNLTLCAISIILLALDLVLLLVQKYKKFQWKKDQNGKHKLDNGSDMISVTLGQLAMIGFSFILPHLVANYFKEGEFHMTQPLYDGIKQS